MDERIANDNPAPLTIGAIAASAAIAGLVAFFLRRAMRSDEEELQEKIAHEISEGDLKERATAATIDFLRAHLAPELKPMLLSVLKDVREYVDKGFQRAEQSIREI